METFTGAKYPSKIPKIDSDKYPNDRLLIGVMQVRLRTRPLIQSKTRIFAYSPLFSPDRRFDRGLVLEPIAAILAVSLSIIVRALFSWLGQSRWIGSTVSSDSASINPESERDNSQPKGVVRRNSRLEQDKSVIVLLEDT